MSKVYACVEWGRDPWKQKQTVRHAHLDPILLEGPAASRRSQRDIRLETWVFWFCVPAGLNRQMANQCWGNFSLCLTRPPPTPPPPPPPPHVWYFEELYLYYSAQWVFFPQSKSGGELHPRPLPNGSSACHNWRIRCSFFARKDRVTLPLSLPSISVYLGLPLSARTSSGLCSNIITILVRSLFMCLSPSVWLPHRRHITYASVLPPPHISNLPQLATTNITFTYWFRSFSQCKYAVITVNLSFC